VRRSGERRALAVSLVVAAVAFAVVLFDFAVVLHFDRFRSDVAAYWRDSLAWTAPYDEFHVPGYPLLLAGVRGLTGSALAPTTVMTVVAFLALLIGVAATYLATRPFASPRVAAVAALLFALWPLVGITDGAYPIADVPAMTFLMVGLACLVRDKPVGAGFGLGAAAVTHKAMWLAVALLVVGYIRAQRQHRQRGVLLVAVTAAPLLALWAGGAIHHRSLSWLFSANFTAEGHSGSDLPVFDGLFGSFLFGGGAQKVKALLAAGVTTLGVAVIVMTIRSRASWKWYATALAALAALLGVVLNQHEIFAVVRFGRLLCFPLALLAARYLDDVRLDRWRLGAGASVAILFGSQLAFAWYIAREFFV
jgi:hypothetical protein